MMIAGLEGDVERRAHDRARGGADRSDLSVGLSRALVVTHGHDAAVFNQHSADVRIRARIAFRGLTERTPHQAAVRRTAHAFPERSVESSAMNSCTSLKSRYTLAKRT